MLCCVNCVCCVFYMQFEQHSSSSVGTRTNIGVFMQ
nr:MAG TPA: hypothetical protein [Caudoviricetes sp.]